MVQSMIETVPMDSTTGHDKQDANEMPPPRHIGREFVRQYYTMLATRPNYVHRFYSHDSIFIHGEDKPITGQADIMQAIKEKNIENCTAKILKVDACKTLGDGVVIQVIGMLNINDRGHQRFNQTFVLAPQSHKNYYVYNDIFRYEEEVGVQDDGTSSEAGTQPPQASFIKPDVDESGERLANGHGPSAPIIPQIEPLHPQPPNNQWSQSNNTGGVTGNGGVGGGGGGGGVEVEVKKDASAGGGGGGGKGDNKSNNNNNNNHNNNNNSVSNPNNNNNNGLSQPPPSDPAPQQPPPNQQQQPQQPSSWARIAGNNASYHPNVTVPPPPTNTIPHFSTPPPQTQLDNSLPQPPPQNQRQNSVQNSIKGNSRCEIFVGQIHPSVKDYALKEYFQEKTGFRVLHCRVKPPTTPNGTSIAFITFQNQQEVDDTLLKGEPIQDERGGEPKYGFLIQLEGGLECMMHVQKSRDNSRPNSDFGRKNPRPGNNIRNPGRGMYQGGGGVGVGYGGGGGGGMRGGRGGNRGGGNRSSFNPAHQNPNFSNK